MLKDGTLVVFHDDDTLRMTGKKIVLKDAVYDDINDLYLNDTKYKIPMFGEVLDLVDGKVLLDIEIKGSDSNFKVCHEICKYLDNYKGKFIVKSFNLVYVLWFRIYRLNFVRGCLISNLILMKMNSLVKYMLFNICFKYLIKPDFIACNYKNLLNKTLDKLKKDGLPILLFTLKEKDIIYYKGYGYIYEE